MLRIKNPIGLKIFRRQPPALILRSQAAGSLGAAKKSGAGIAAAVVISADASNAAGAGRAAADGAEDGT
ncbi:MAG: hypothetical protein MUC28_04095, partial [Planctomycetes bacterium]|nr:hypothetical protein [Planctomycetota bacterium]